VEKSEHNQNMLESTSVCFGDRITDYFFQPAFQLHATVQRQQELPSNRCTVAAV